MRWIVEAREERGAVLRDKFVETPLVLSAFTAVTNDARSAAVSVD